MQQLGRWLRIVPIAAVLLSLSITLSGAWWNGLLGGDDYRESRMPVSNAVTDSGAILQYALPIDNGSVRQMQRTLEDMSQDLRGGKRWSSIANRIKKVKNTLKVKRNDLLADVQPAQQDEAVSIIDTLLDNVVAITAAAEARDRNAIWEQRRLMLNAIGDLEALMVGEFPFEIPAEYASLPQLKGRAVVELETEKGTIELTVDGFNAPITAGNFIDLVQRGFYAGTQVNRAEEFYVVQAGDPPGPADGFIDPTTGQERTIPLEIKVKTESEPVYGIPLEDVGLYREPPELPFSAYGTVAMAHRDDDPNSASSQFFFFLFEPELTPAGLNLLDGRYSVFGYVNGGGEAVLSELRKGDAIVSARVLSGLEYFVPGSEA